MLGVGVGAIGVKEAAAVDVLGVSVDSCVGVVEAARLAVLLMLRVGESVRREVLSVPSSSGLGEAGAVNVRGAGLFAGLFAGTLLSVLQKIGSYYIKLSSGNNILKKYQLKTETETIYSKVPSLDIFLE